MPLRTSTGVSCGSRSRRINGRWCGSLISRPALLLVWFYNNNINVKVSLRRSIKLNVNYNDNAVRRNFFCGSTGIN